MRRRPEVHSDFKAQDLGFELQGWGVGVVCPDTVILAILGGVIQDECVTDA